MRCPECKKLSLEFECTAFDYQELVRLREADAPGLLQSGPNIWDFIIEMAIKKREDAEKTLAHHRARHPSILTWPVSILTVLTQTDTSEAAEFWEAFSGVGQPILAAAAVQAASFPALL